MSNRASAIKALEYELTGPIPTTAWQAGRKAGVEFAIQLLLEQEIAAEATGTPNTGDRFKAAIVAIEMAMAKVSEASRSFETDEEDMLARGSQPLPETSEIREAIGVVHDTLTQAYCDMQNTEDLLARSI